MRAQGSGKRAVDDQARRRKSLIAFALVEGAFILLVTLPVLLWLFVFQNGLSEAELARYAIGIVVVQMVVSCLLIWKFRLLPAAPMDKKDAR